MYGFPLRGLIVPIFRLRGAPPRTPTGALAPDPVLQVGPNMDLYTVTPPDGQRADIHSTHSASAALALSSVWAGGAYTGT